MAYVEVWKEGKLITRRQVDEEKARRGCRIRLGEAGQVRVKAGETTIVGRYEVRMFAGDIPETKQVTEERSLDLPEPNEGSAKAASTVSTFSRTMAAGIREEASYFPEIEGYKVTGRLGEGGMGTVWRAAQLSTHREVALKLLSERRFESKKSRLRFVREVDLTARLVHPNIARLYDSGLYRGIYYYAMELVDGVHLDQYVKEQNLSQRQILELMWVVCQAVHHAHKRGVIHRDLKPSNILVSQDGQPHVLDFGLAKAFLKESSDVTVSIEGDVAGTPAYMSPEQAMGRKEQIDTRTDVYSLGIILYQFLTGESPHELSGTRFEIIRRIVEEDVRGPRQINKDIDFDLDALLLKALARDPDDRYLSAGEMADDIDNYLNGKPLMAMASSTVYLLRKKIRKCLKPIMVSILGLTLLAAIFIFGYFYVEGVKKNLRKELASRFANPPPYSEAAKETIVPQPSTEDEKTVRFLSQQFISAFAEQDINLFSQLLAENFTGEISDGAVLQGKEQAIENFRNFTENIRNNVKNPKVNYQMQSVKMAENEAIVLGEITISGQTTTDNLPFSVKIVQTLTFHKINNNWQLTKEHSIGANGVPPVEQAEQQLQAQRQRAAAQPAQSLPDMAVSGGVQNNFVAIFNGRDLTGWEVVGQTEPSWWVVEEGTIKCRGKKGGWLSTTKEYGDFELSLEFNISAGGNSGVFVRAPRGGRPSYDGLEIQILDDSIYAGQRPARDLGGAIWNIVGPSTSVVRPAGQWNSLNIRCEGTKVKVVLNDVVTVDTNLNDHLAKLAQHPGLKRKNGYIGLQDYGTEVSFRNIRIREISGDKTAGSSAAEITAIGAASDSSPMPVAKKKILFYSESAGYKHPVVTRPSSHELSYAEKVFTDFATKAGYEVSCSQDSKDLQTEEQLSRFDAIVFYTAGSPQINRKTLVNWLGSGKAIIGVHSCAAGFSFEDWVEYRQIIGGPANITVHGGDRETVTIKAEDSNHQATRMLPDAWVLADEIYQFKELSRANIHTLLSIDTGKMAKANLAYHKLEKGKYYPIAWTNTYEKGRVFYTALGHREEVWTNPMFQQHLLGGITWATSMNVASGVQNLEKQRWNPRRAAAPAAIQVDGKPFFVICARSAVPEEFEEYKNIGFNTVYTHLSSNPALDEAKKYGLYVIHHFADYKCKDGLYLPEFWQEAEQQITTWNSHPALLAWMQATDLLYRHRNPSEIKKFFDLLSAKSPDRLKLLAYDFDDNNWTQLYQYNAYSDVVVLENFHIRKNIPATALWFERASKFSNGRPIWYIVFACIYQNQVPSANEVRSSAYLGINHGATGILIDGFQSRLWKEWGVNNVPGLADPRLAGLRREALRVTSELKELSPAILAGTVLNGVQNGQDNGLLDVKSYADGDKLYIIAVNTSGDSIQVSFYVPMIMESKIGLLGEERSVSHREGNFNDGFAPYETHVYILRASGSASSSQPASADVISASIRDTSATRKTSQQPASVRLKDDKFPLRTAVVQGDIEEVKELVAKGYNVNTPDGAKWTPLHNAAQAGRKEITELLIVRGAEVNAKNNLDWTALMFAAVEGHTEVVKFLIEKGADVNAKNNKVWTALMFATQKGRLDIVNLLIEKGAEVNAKNDLGWTALMFATAEGHTEVAKFLIEKGADINAKNNDGWTALMFASGEGRPAVVISLLEKNADVNAKNKDGWTALIFATFKGHSDIAKSLIENGADVNVKNKRGDTALSIAKAANNKTLIELLEKYNAKDKTD
jgi:serine/threonine protein kinase/ankyrin repeat protein/type 1 glutamine amidotransferase